MGVNCNLFRSAPDGDRVKWKTTDAILFPGGRGMKKIAWAPSSLKKGSWMAQSTGQVFDTGM